MQPDQPPQEGAISVLYADEALVILNKPAGLLAVPGRGPDKQDCLSTRVQALYPDALVVHRLDMATSGLVVMARGAPAQRLLSEAFAQREVHKRYVAVVSGQLTPTAEGWHTIDLPILVDWPNRPRRMIDWQQGKA
ncbi:MAG: pseudouridine synthase, partial [Rhodoferax sp.]